MDAQGVLIDLDALLDTRLGALSLSTGMDVAEILKCGYHDRTSDDMSVLDKRLDTVAFKKLYDHRNNTVMQNSMMTNLLDFLHTFFKDIRHESLYAADIPEIIVTLNIYPYTLDDDARHMLVNAVSNHIGIYKVNVVSLPLVSLIPDYIKANYRTVFMYHFREWYLLHYKQLKDKKIPQVGFYVPKLNADVATQEAHKKDIEQDKSLASMPRDLEPFNTLTLLLIEYLSIQYLEVGYFSIFSPKTHRD
jgi:hypothetical protein